MLRTRLLQAVCTVAMLAAAPAFAQNSGSSPADTGAGNTPNAPMGAPNNSTNTMSPANNMGSNTTNNGEAATESHSTHRSAMAHPEHMMRGRSDRSQDAAVDQLNDQSLHAARSGQAFNGSGSGGMNNMSGGSMQGGSMQGGSMPNGSMPNGSMPNGSMSGGSMSGGGQSGSGAGTMTK